MSENPKKKVTLYVRAKREEKVAKKKLTPQQRHLKKLADWENASDSEGWTQVGPVAFGLGILSSKQFSFFLFPVDKWNPKVRTMRGGYPFELWNGQQVQKIFYDLVTLKPSIRNLVNQRESEILQGHRKPYREYFEKYSLKSNDRIGGGSGREGDENGLEEMIEAKKFIFLTPIEKYYSKRLNLVRRVLKLLPVEWDSTVCLIEVHRNLDIQKGLVDLIPEIFTYFLISDRVRSYITTCDKLYLWVIRVILDECYELKFRKGGKKILNQMNEDKLSYYNEMIKCKWSNTSIRIELIPRECDIINTQGVVVTDDPEGGGEEGIEGDLVEEIGEEILV